MRLLDRAIDDDVAIVVEDAQWTDGASDALLSRLAVAAQQRPGWSMVVLRRMVDEGFTPGGYTLQLGPMDDGEVRELLVSLSPVPLRPDEVQSLVNRAAGSPLVLDALVRLGRERGAVDDLPSTLESLIAAEIDVLSPFPRLLLSYASVLGRSFNPLVWRQLLDDDGIEIDEGVTAELKQFVEFDPSGSARFRQAVVRDVAYRGLPYRRRQVLHLRAGQVMEEVAAGNVDSVADLLSVHFYEGGDLERAWRYARLAGVERPALPRQRRRGGPLPAGAGGGPSAAGVQADELRATWTALGDVLEQAGLARGRAGRVPTSDGAGPTTTTWSELGSSSSVPASGSGPAAFVTALRELRAPSGSLGARPSDDAERVRRGRRRRCEPSCTRARSSLGEPSWRRSEPRRRPSAIGELRDLANAFNVIDWAHVFAGRPGPGGAPTPDRRRSTSRSASRIELAGALGEPGSRLLLAGSMGRGTRLLPEGARGLRR